MIRVATSCVVAAVLFFVVGPAVAAAQSCPSGSCGRNDVVVVKGVPAPVGDDGILDGNGDSSRLPLAAVFGGLAVFGSTLVVIARRRRATLLAQSPALLGDGLDVATHATPEPSWAR